MKIRKRNLPIGSYNVTTTIMYPKYNGNIYAYVKDNKSPIMLNFRSFCRFVLFMMRMNFSCRFKFPTQVELEEKVRPHITNNLYRLEVMTNHMNKVEREAIDENGAETIIYQVFDDPIGGDIYLRIRQSIQEIAENASSPTKSIFKIAGLSPEEIFVQPNDSFKANFIQGKKDIYCVIYDDEIWYRFTDFNRMFNIQRTNLVTNKINVNDFKVYDGYLYCNVNEITNSIINMDISDEDKIKYLDAFEIPTCGLFTKSEEHKEESFTVNVADNKFEVIASELKDEGNSKLTVPTELVSETTTEDKTEKADDTMDDSQLVTVKARIDRDLRDKANDLFNDFGLTMSRAIDIFIRQCVRENKIPFEIKREDSISELIVNKQSDTVKYVNETIMTMNEAAAYLGTRRDMIYYYIKYKPDFPAHHRSENKRGYYFIKEELDAWVNDNRVEGINLRHIGRKYNINASKVSVLARMKDFPKAINTNPCNKLFNEEEVDTWMKKNHDIAFGCSRKNILEFVIPGNKSEEQTIKMQEEEFKELITEHNVETNSLVAFNLDRRCLRGKRPIIYETNYVSAINDEEFFKVAYRATADKNLEYQLIPDPYKFIKIKHNDYDLTIVDRTNLCIYRNYPVEFIFVKDNNAVEHGIGGSLPFDYIFVKASDFVDSITHFEDKNEKDAKAYCSLALNRSGVNLIMAYSKYRKASVKFIQVSDIENLYNFLSNDSYFKDHLRYDAIGKLKKVVLIELDEYVKRNREHMNYKRKMVDYIDDIFNSIKDGVVNNMARHIFSEKTVKEILNSREIGEFTYGSIILSESLRGVIGLYREAYKECEGMPSLASFSKPSNSSLIKDVWGFINKSEYFESPIKPFVEKVQEMEQRYNNMVDTYNKYVTDDKKIESIFDE